MMNFLRQLAAALSTPVSDCYSREMTPLLAQSLQYDVAYLDRLTRPASRE